VIQHDKASAIHAWYIWPSHCACAPSHFFSFSASHILASMMLVCTAWQSMCFFFLLCQNSEVLPTSPLYVVGWSSKIQSRCSFAALSNKPSNVYVLQQLHSSLYCYNCNLWILLMYCVLVAITPELLLLQVRQNHYLVLKCFFCNYAWTTKTF